MTSEFDVEAAFRAAAAARGLELPARLEADGSLHRCGTTEKPHAKDGAYLLHLDGIPAGGFENHRDGQEWENWCSQAENSMSDLERAEHRARVAAAKKIRDEELAARRAKAKTMAQKTWSGSLPANGHPYLAKKGVKAHGARANSGKLLLSVSDADGEIHSFQTIDAAGEKMFAPGGRIKGCFYAIGDLAKAATILVAEGFATAASVYEATGVPAVAAFDCGNLRPVCEALRRRYPRAKIVVCADDDVDTKGNPGLTKAREAAEAVGGAVAVPRFANRAAGQTDFNDLHKSAGAAAVKAIVVRLVGAAFAPSRSRLAGEKAERLEDARHILRFGVKYLDDALGGIRRTDLILVGAGKTGAGKTQLATIVSRVNCRVGKHVHYFALEAEDKEIERRMKYQILAGMYYAEDGGHRPIRYLDWIDGLLEDDLGRFDDRAEEELERSTMNLHTYYKDEIFTSDDFAQQFEEVKEETDLVVLDHFHYVDSKNDDSNENRAAKKIAMQIRNSALRAKRPVLVVGHSRKSDRQHSGLLPTEEDFYGNKDLVNNATKAIMLAPDFDTDTGDPTLWSTYMQVVKCRTDSSLTRFAAKVVFDVRSDTYRQEYQLGRLVANGKKWVELNPGQVPAWKSSPRGLAVDTISVAEAAE